jgi:hypothetical protein
VPISGLITCTGWQNSLVDSCLAKVAFLHDVIPGVDEAKVVRAGGHAVAAANTVPEVDYHSVTLFGHQISLNNL